MYSESTSLKRFNVIEKLGEGSFSCVYKVQRFDDKKIYAMKKVKINQMKQKQKENALNQIRILASISHPNIINYKQAFFDDKTQSLCVVMELADAGDIQIKINEHKKNKTFFNQTEIWQAMIQMTKGLKVLHQIKILHRDLKCANVFCTKEGRYKLGDMNVSKVAKRGMARTQTGTPYYTSPQVWNDKLYDSKCDIWSLACVVYEMASLNPPFRANNLKQLYTKIQKGIYPNIPSFYSEDLKSIISQCLKVNPTQRPSAVELLQHPKVIRNMPVSEAYNQENNQTSKAALLKTILVPKSMRNLKQALPGSKYDDVNDCSSERGRKCKRVNSAQNLRRPEGPMSIISTPKAGEAPQSKYNLKYALMRRPSGHLSNRQAPKSELRQLSKNNSNSNIRNNISSISHRPAAGMRIQRNNSVDYINHRNRVNSRESIDREANNISSSRRRESIDREANNIRSSRRRESIDREANNISSSRRRENSVSKDKVKVCMQDISNRCRQIEERVKNLMDKKKESVGQEQKNPNIPLQKKYLFQRKISGRGDLNNSRERNNHSVNSNRSRHNSVASNKNVNNSCRSIDSDRMAKKQAVLKRDSSQDRYRKLSNERKILSRQKSRQRLPSVQIRKDSSLKRIIQPGVVPPKSYLYRAPPRLNNNK